MVYLHKRMCCAAIWSLNTVILSSITAVVYKEPNLPGYERKLNFFLLNNSDEYYFTCVLKNMCSGKHPRFYIKNFYRGIVCKVNLDIFI